MLNEREKELLEIIMSFNSKGIAPTRSQIEGQSKFARTGYNKNRLNDLIHKGYLKRDGHKYYAMFTFGGESFNAGVAVQEVHLETAAQDNYAVWVILGIARYNRAATYLLKKEILSVINAPKVHEQFVLLYLLRLILEDPDKVPSIDVPLKWKEGIEVDAERFVESLSETINVRKRMEFKEIDNSKKENDNSNDEIDDREYETADGELINRHSEKWKYTEWREYIDNS